MRIGIVNDMKVAVEVLRRSLSLVPEYQVIWTALNGEEAVRKCAADRPDLVLMDLLMPVMDGIEATKRIMQQSPCAILIVTGSMTGRTGMVFEAMGYGALDVVKTPPLGSQNTLDGVEELLKKIDVIARVIGKEPRHSKTTFQEPYFNSKDKGMRLPPLVLMGASTGGPMALAEILSNFPEDVNFATLIVQHVDQEFAASLGHWLGKQISLPVQLVYSGLKPTAGRVYLAAENRQLVLNRRLELEYEGTGSTEKFCPSIDSLFSSVSKFWPEPCVAALLTGMGSDGALGLKALKEAGWYTIAEHERSCVVFGMPRAAIEKGAVVDVLTLDNIPGAILAHVAMKTPVASV